MSVTLKPPAPPAERPASARSEQTAKAEASKREDGGRFKDELREARRSDRGRDPQTESRADAADAAPGATDETGWRHRPWAFGLQEGDPAGPNDAPPVAEQAAAAPASASSATAGAAPHAAAAAPVAGATEPQMPPVDAEALAPTTAKPPVTAETAPQQAAKPVAVTGDLMLSQQPETDRSQTDDAAGDLDLFTEQSLKSAAGEAQAKTPATPPAARAMPAVVPLDQVAVHIATSAAKGIDKIQIHLTPASLGRIDVEMEVGHDGRIDAVVRVDKPETMELLQRDARQLVRALQDAGLQADSGSLSFELRDQGGQQQDRPTRAGSQALNDNGAASGIADAAETAPQPPTRRMMPGGVDIIA